MTTTIANNATKKIIGRTEYVTIIFSTQKTRGKMLYKHKQCAKKYFPRKWLVFS